VHSAVIERTLKDGALAWECLKRLHAVLEKEFDLKLTCSIASIAPRRLAKSGVLILYNKIINTYSTIQPFSGHLPSSEATDPIEATQILILGPCIAI